LTRLEIKNLRAGYGRVEIIHDVSLEVGDKDIVAIIGPNGSGKSTLLKSVVGLTNIFSGSVRLDGEELVGRSTEDIARAGVAFIPQADNVFTNLTCDENLELGAYRITDRKLLASRIAEMYNVFHEIERFREKRAGLLSGGERQMLAIARALIAKPKVLMLDEPTANLSPKAALTVAQRLLEIKESGIPVVLVEQNVKFALELAERVCVLVSGTKTYEGTAEELMKMDLQQVFLGLRRKMGG